MTKEIKEAKSLRWLANQFPLIENPKDDADKMVNCIHIYCTAAAERLEQMEKEYTDVCGKYETAHLEKGLLEDKLTIKVNTLQTELESTEAERDKALQFIKELFGCGDCVYGHTGETDPPCDKCRAHEKANGAFSEWKWRGLQS